MKTLSGLLTAFLCLPGMISAQNKLDLKGMDQPGTDTASCFISLSFSEESNLSMNVSPSVRPETLWAQSGHADSESGQSRETESLRIFPEPDFIVEDSSACLFPAYVPSKRKTGFFLGTNLMSDMLLIPSVGLQARLGDWSLAADGAFAWWNLKALHYYWRYYGGNLSLCRYFRTDALPEVLRNTFLGVYAGFCSYDFELGETGRMADPLKGKLEYRSGLALGFRYLVYSYLSLEVSLGFGCSWGKYDEYYPIDGHYVWQRSRWHQTWCPNRIQISFWLPLDFIVPGKEVIYEN